MHVILLQGMIEFDEGYFTVESSEIEQEKGIRGRGAVGKSNVAIMAKSTVLEDIETGEKSNQCRYFKAKVLKDHTSEQINETILESLSLKKVFFLQIKVLLILILQTMLKYT